MAQQKRRTKRQRQFSFCFSQRYDPFVVGPLGPEKSPDGDTTNGICGIINCKMRIAEKIESRLILVKFCAKDKFSSFLIKSVGQLIRPRLREDSGGVTWLAI
jgi:hypothetical protein